MNIIVDSFVKLQKLKNKINRKIYLQNIQIQSKYFTIQYDNITIKFKFVDQNNIENRLLTWIYKNINYITEYTLNKYLGSIPDEFNIICKINDKKFPIKINIKDLCELFYGVEMYDYNLLNIANVIIKKIVY